jgi:hypothetical protein
VSGEECPASSISRVGGHRHLKEVHAGVSDTYQGVDDMVELSNEVVAVSVSDVELVEDEGIRGVRTFSSESLVEASLF